MSSGQKYKFIGTVERRLVAKGSKSEHEAIVLLPDGTPIRRSSFVYREKIPSCTRLFSSLSASALVSKLPSILQVHRRPSKSFPILQL